MERKDPSLDRKKGPERAYRLHAIIGALLELALSPTTPSQLLIEREAAERRAQTKTIPDRDGE